MGTFLMHPAKTGGTSAREVLKELRVDFTRTEEISPTPEWSRRLVSGKGNTLIHGHIDKIARPRDKEELGHYIRIISCILDEYNLVVPTRNPANSVQSWMHYSKFIANRMTKEMAVTGNKSSKRPGKHMAMYQRMLPLRQDRIVIEGGRLLVKGLVELREEDEEHNLERFMNLLVEHKRTQKAVLMPLSWQIFFRELKRLDTLEREGCLAIPESSSYRRVIYFDCEDYGSKREEMDGILGEGFTERLNTTRANESGGRKIKGSELRSIVEMSKKIVPMEWTIFNKSG